MSFPILYDKRAQSFDNMGLGALTDCLKCNVTREINGAYELTLEYPVEGVHFNEIGLESLIAAKVPDKENWQLFKVYSMSEPIDLTVIIDCEHITYLAGDIPLKNFSTQTGGDLRGIDAILYAMTHTAIPEGVTNPFTITSDLPPDYTVFTLPEPATLREVMSNESGMLLSMDEYKDDEWDYDNFNIVLKAKLGTDKSDSIHYVYGKNVSDLSQDQSLTNTVTAIYPYVHAETDEGKPVNVIGSVCYGTGYENFVHQRIVPVNVESYFTDEEKDKWKKDPNGIKMPTPDEVNAKASEAIKDFDFVCNPEITIKINPVDLTGISGYEEVAENLKRVQLGDTITVIFDAYNIERKSRIVKTVYNILDECNDSVEVGDPSPNLAATLATIGEKTEVNRAGIIIKKDSILAYVDKVNGEMGTQFKMTEDEIKSTVAQYGGVWNMVPLTGSPSIFGEGWTINYYNYGNPNDIDMYRNLGPESAGWNYFDEETGYVWTCVLQSDEYVWVRKKFARGHEFRYYKGDEFVIEQAYPGQDSYTIRMDSYCESNITQVGSEIKAEVRRASDREDAIFDMVPGEIMLSVSNPTDGDRRAGITITTKNNDGSIHEQDTGYIILTGTCVFQSDLTDGYTVISGNNIKTGKVSAQRIDVDNLIAKHITTNADINTSYYMDMQYGRIRSYDPNNVQRATVQVYAFPLFYRDDGTWTIDTTYYYGIEINNRGVNSKAVTRYLFAGQRKGTLLRVWREDGHFMPPISVILQGFDAIAEWLNLEVYIGTPYDELDPTEDTVTSKQIKAVFNSTNRRIQFKNANTSSQDPDKMAATVNYVKYYVDEGSESDRRWKNSIQDIEDVSDDYMRLRPVRYKFNPGVDDQGKDDELRFGLIAQELKEVYPESVYHIVNHVIPDKDEITGGIRQYTPTDYYKVRYEELHALHISMIQKHERQIEEMQKKIDELLQNREE